MRVVVRAFDRVANLLLHAHAHAHAHAHTQVCVGVCVWVCVCVCEEEERNLSLTSWPAVCPAPLCVCVWMRRSCDVLESADDVRLYCYAMRRYEPSVVTHTLYASDLCGGCRR
jgi:hypothetical protein